MPRDPWLITSRPRPGARLRLLCLPYAGGGPAIYRDWPDQLPEWVEVTAVALPGRAARFGEPAHRSLDTLLPALVGAWSPREPYVLFGHSMGALVSFELCRALRRERLAPPVGLVVSGRRAPHLPRRPGLPIVHQLPTPELLDQLRRYGGTPEELLAAPELLELFLPTLRADFTLVETYEPRTEPPLDLPIIAYGGSEDEEVPERDVAAWQIHTTDRFGWEMFRGGHFFLNDNPDVLRRLGKDLELVSTAAADRGNPGGGRDAAG